jgi:hypothetical protein
MACDLVDEKGVYLTTGNPLPSDIESVVNWLLNEEFTTAFQSECAAAHEELRTIQGPPASSLLSCNAHC